MANYAIILLAGGPSSRLGHPKQRIPFGSITLLEHLARQAVSSLAQHTYIVLGAAASEIFSSFNSKSVIILNNEHWQEGMASSIRCGISAIKDRAAHTDAIIIMTCDQPYVTTQILNSIIRAFESSGMPIVTCDYGPATGPPVLFHRSLFEELMKLNGDRGAKMIVESYPTQVETIYFPDGVIDIDTEIDLESWLDQTKHGDTQENV